MPIEHKIDKTNEDGVIISPIFAIKPIPDITNNTKAHKRIPNTDFITTPSSS
jgi:hypothetical protein